jgi:hypothetical protein
VDPTVIVFYTTPVDVTNAACPVDRQTRYW